MFMWVHCMFEDQIRYWAALCHICQNWLRARCSRTGTVPAHYDNHKKFMFQRGGGVLINVLLWGNPPITIGFPSQRESSVTRGFPYKGTELGKMFQYCGIILNSFSNAGHWDDGDENGSEWWSKQHLSWANAGMYRENSKISNLFH